MPSSEVTCFRLYSVNRENYKSLIGMVTFLDLYYIALIIIIRLLSNVTDDLQMVNMFSVVLCGPLFVFPSSLLFCCHIIVILLPVLSVLSFWYIQTFL
jgi:hypothetical protein